MHPGEATALHLLYTSSSRKGQVAGLRAMQDIHGPLPADSQEEESRAIAGAPYLVGTQTKPLEHSTLDICCHHSPLCPL